MHIYATIEPYLILSIQNKLDKLPNKRGIKTNFTKWSMIIWSLTREKICLKNSSYLSFQKAYYFLLCYVNDT